MKFFSLKKGLFILNQEQKKYLYFVFVFILISMFLEALSVGIVLPLFSILLKVIPFDKFDFQ